jgi:hypothetical protein
MLILFGSHLPNYDEKAPFSHQNYLKTNLIYWSVKIFVTTYH